MTRHRLVILVVGLSILAFVVALVLLVLPISAGPADVSLPSCGNGFSANPAAAVTRWDGVVEVCAGRRWDRLLQAFEFLVIGLAGLAAGGAITMVGRLGTVGASAARFNGARHH